MKNKSCIVFAFLFLFFLNINQSFSQQINPKIQEVFGSKTQEILNNNPEQIKLFTELLENRLKIVELPLSSVEDKYIKLSTMPLLNKYNPSLTRDVVFDINTFNPLKYNLNFFSNKVEVYRIDNTDYVIVINPQSSK